MRLVTLALLAVLASGLGSGQTLSHWQHQAHLRAQVTDALARAFEAERPGVRVATEHIPFGQYIDKLVTALASNTAADVFQVPADMAEQLIGAALIAPMPEALASAEEARARLVPWTLRYLKNDRLYGLPVDAQTLVLYVNDRLYEEAGFSAADYPRTWHALSAQAKAATRRSESGEMEIAGLDTRYYRALLMTALYGASERPVIGEDGQVHYGEASEQAGFRWLADLLRGEGRVRDPEFLPGQRLFELGRAVFYVNHPSARASVEQAFADGPFGYTVLPLPRRSEEAPPFTVGSHWAWVVNARSSHAELAWDWILYGTSEEAQRLWFATSGDLPTRIDIACDPDLAQGAADRVILDSLTYARPELQLGRGEVEPIYARLWERLTLTDDPLERILADAARAHDAVNAEWLRRYGAEAVTELASMARGRELSCP